MKIVRSFEFDAGHRLLRHESKCRNVHGHRYRVELAMGASHLDSIGRVLDFGRIKEVVGQFFEDRYDHGYIGEENDPVLEVVRAQGLKAIEIPIPPTIENLAALWLEEIRFECETSGIAAMGVQALGMRAFETPNCWTVVGDW